MAALSAPLSLTLRQWCGNCQAMTGNRPCGPCGAPWVACARCGDHPGHISTRFNPPGDDDE